jgi:hypothetical protein
MGLGVYHHEEEGCVPCIGRRPGSPEYRLGMGSGRLLMVAPAAAKIAVKTAAKRASKRRAAQKVAVYAAKGGGRYVVRHVQRHAAATRRVSRSLARKQIPNGADLLELIEAGAIYYTASKPVRKAAKRRRDGKSKRR